MRCLPNRCGPHMSLQNASCDLHGDFVAVFGVLVSFCPSLHVFLFREAVPILSKAFFMSCLYVFHVL